MVFDDLAAIKARRWFYEFELPDGSVTESYLSPSFRPIHQALRTRLRQVIAERVANPRALTAIDLGCHEGYFTVELARHFRHVRGVDVRMENIDGARLIARALGLLNTTFDVADVLTLPTDEHFRADLVTMFGLIYHLENPLQAIRTAAALTRRHLVIETQVFPYDIGGRIEDGGFQQQRNVQGVFALVPDYPANREGGATGLALVPSVNAVVFALQSLGFPNVELIGMAGADYEQYARGARVVMLATKG
jgi:tRNA (mo5U34)-methyltransferase